MPKDYEKQYQGRPENIEKYMLKINEDPEALGRGVNRTRDELVADIAERKKKYDELQAEKAKRPQRPRRTGTSGGLAESVIEEEEKRRKALGR